MKEVLDITGKDCDFVLKRERERSRIREHSDHLSAGRPSQSRVLVGLLVLKTARRVEGRCPLPFVPNLQTRKQPIKSYSCNANKKMPASYGLFVIYSWNTLGFTLIC